MNLAVREAAKLLSVTERTIYRWIDQGVLPVYRVNEQYRFDRTELLEWATSRKLNVSVQVLTEPEGDSTQCCSLTGALKAGGVFYRVDGTDKASVLRTVVEITRLPEEVDREFLFQVLLEREAVGPTGIGDGIAIPHVRNPVVLHVTQPSITLCFCEHPIDFDSLDGQPVTMLFVLISPTVRSHLHMLSRLGFVLRDPDVLAVLKRQASRDEILAEIGRAEASLVVPENKTGGDS
jgi:PTS system nitrogen regulatory IIA component